MNLKRLKRIIKEEVKKLYEQQIIPNEGTTGCCDPNAINYNQSVENCDQCTCVMITPNGQVMTGNAYPGNAGQCGTTMGANYPGTGPTLAVTCNTQQWANYTGWVDHFGYIVNNANNPCQFMSNKLQVWMNNIAGANMNQANQLACKIKHVQTQLQPMYNC